MDNSVRLPDEYPLQFQKVLRKEEEGEGEENKTNFEGAYLRNSLADSAQILNWKCPTPRENFVCFCSESVELQMRVFYTPVHTCLSCATGFLGRTTHYRVS